MIEVEKLRKLKGRRIYLFWLDEETGDITDVTSRDDVVQVIRCKDCKYAKKIYLKNLPWLKPWEYSCQYFNTHSVMGDGYCNNAERKEE